MEAKKKRLTLDLDPPFQRRIKVIAALKGISMRQYCQSAIEKELAKDEAIDINTLPSGEETISRLSSVDHEVTRYRSSPEEPSDLIKEIRASRVRHQ